MGGVGSARGLLGKLSDFTNPFLSGMLSTPQLGRRCFQHSCSVSVGSRPLRSTRALRKQQLAEGPSLQARSSRVSLDNNAVATLFDDEELTASGACGTDGGCGCGWVPTTHRPSSRDSMRKASCAVLNCSAFVHSYRDYHGARGTQGRGQEWHAVPHPHLWLPGGFVRLHACYSWR